MSGIYSSLDAIIGVQSALGGRGGGLRYLLRDEFVTDRAAGSVNGTAAEPGPGTRTATVANVTMSGGKIASVGDGVWGNSGWTNSVAVTRAAGRPLIVRFRRSSSNTALLGFLSTPGSYLFTPYNNVGIELTTGALGLRSTTSATIRYTLPIADGTDYLVAVPLRAAGRMYLIKGGAYTNWTLAGIDEASSASPLYVGQSVLTNTISVSVDFIRVPDALWLPTPIVSYGFDE